MRFSFSVDGEKVDEIKVVQTPQEYEDGLKIIINIFKEFSKSAKIEKIVGGVAGVLDSDRSCLLKAHNLHNWENKTLKNDLIKETGCVVNLENDAALEGLGESVFGAGKDYDIVAYLTVGTGVGGVRIVDKKIDRKAIGFEPGHMILNLDGNFDLGDMVSGGGLEKKYKKESEEIKDEKVWEEASKYLAIGIFNTALFWSPNIIVLGGGLILNNAIPFEKVKVYLKDIKWSYPNFPEIKKAQLGELSGVMGAIHYAKSY